MKIAYKYVSSLPPDNREANSWVPACNHHRPNEGQFCGNSHSHSLVEKALNAILGHVDTDPGAERESCMRFFSPRSRGSTFQLALSQFLMSTEMFAKSLPPQKYFLKLSRIWDWQGYRCIQATKKREGIKEGTFKRIPKIWPVLGMTLSDCAKQIQSHIKMSD